MGRIVVPYEQKAVTDEGTFKGYGAVFNNIDLGRDIIMPGAFDKTLKSGRMVKMLYQHDRKEPIGSYPVLNPDEKGLAVEGALVKGVQRADETHLLMKAKVIDGLSIGYVTKRAEDDTKNNTRKLIEVDLWEISPVVFPMNESATVTQVKSVRDFEELLTRDAGMTRKEALVVINKGYKALQAMRDAGSDELAGIAEMIARNTTILKGE